MSILSRYILCQFWRYFFLALTAFVGIYLLVEFVEKVDNFIARNASRDVYLLYFLNKIPMILTQVTPMAVLMGVFLTLGGLSRSNELTAMRAGGVSLWRLSTPLLGAALVITLAMTGLSEWVAPLSAKKVNFISRNVLRGGPGELLSRGRVWLRTRDAIVNVGLIPPGKNVLQKLSIFELSQDFTLISRSDIDTALYQNGQWVGNKISIRQFDPHDGHLTKVEKLNDKAIPKLQKKPDYFSEPEPESSDLSFRQLRTLTRQLTKDGYNPGRFLVDMHTRLAAPVACIIMAFMGIPFALQKGRDANLAMGIAISVVIGVAYYVIQAILHAFGYSGILPPAIASWSANVLFAMSGVWLLLSTRD